VTIGEAVNYLMEDHLRAYATQTGMNPSEERLRETKVHQCLEKNNGVISGAFEAYSEGPFLKMSSFVAFCSDCGKFGGKDLSLEEIRAIVGESHHHRWKPGHAHHGHNMIVQNATEIGDGVMLFEEFCDAIVRMSNTVYNEQKPLSDKTNRVCANILTPLLKALGEEEEKEEVVVKKVTIVEDVVEEEEKEKAVPAAEEKKEEGDAAEEKKEEEVAPVVVEPPKIVLKGKTLKDKPKARPPRRM